MKTNKLKQQSKVVSLRLSQNDYLLMVEEAENKNTGIADVLRSAWKEHLSSEDLRMQLAKLENRMISRTFEIVCSVAGVDDQERRIALKKFRNRIKEEVQR